MKRWAITTGVSALTTSKSGLKSGRFISLTYLAYFSFFVICSRLPFFNFIITFRYPSKLEAWWKRMVAFTFYLGAIVNNHDAKRSADFPIVKRAVNRVLRDKNDSWFAKCEYFCSFAYFAYFPSVTSSWSPCQSGCVMPGASDASAKTPATMGSTIVI